MLPIYKKVENEAISQVYILELGTLMQKFKNDKLLTYLEVEAYDGIIQSNTLILNE